MSLFPNNSIYKKRIKTLVSGEGRESTVSYRAEQVYESPTMVFMVSAQPWRETLEEAKEDFSVYEMHEADDIATEKMRQEDAKEYCRECHFPLKNKGDLCCYPEEYD